MDKYYISTSIAYTNGPPHLGHAMEFVLADILARYHAKNGKDVFFSTGTDEHGGKIADKAADSGQDVSSFVTNLADDFKALCQELNVNYTKFIRTTDSEHEKRVALVWKTLEKDMYMGTYKGMYDQREEEFISETEAKEIKKTNPERYQRLIPLEEKNYFFKLSSYSEQIRQAIVADELRIVPKSKKNEILSLIDQGLEDLSVSRPSEKLKWGIPVPGDSSQTIYVWVDALANYITTLGYPDGENFKKYWPADLHVVGKDIIRFHATIWPALLIGLGLPLPKNIYVHGFINVDGEKMSKSVGNVVSPREIINQYSADVFRYYFTRHIPSHDDGDFSWDKIKIAYNTELANDLGNLVSRTSSMIMKYQDGVIGDIPESMHDEEPYHQAMKDYRFDKALEHVWSLVRGLNQYIEVEKPWQVAKKDQKQLQEILAYISGGLLQIGDLLSPFMPDTSAKIIKVFATEVVKPLDQSLFPKSED